MYVEYDPSSQNTPHPNRQFDQFEATTLFCSRCKKAVPVRKKLLLALPDGDKYDYLCVYCGNSAGTKTERSAMQTQIIFK
ncbi:MAG: cytoplasmic protein [Candidatus Hodarchaeota archaeon]